MYRKRILFFIVSAALLVSCGSQKTVVKKFYVIEYPEIYDVISVDSLPLTSAFCRIQDVEVYPAYAARQIAHRNRSNEIQYYQNHEWAVRPEIFLNHLVRDYLEKTNIFAGVATRYWKVEPEYSFETTIYNLEILQQESKLSAHVRLEMRLVERVSGKTLVRHTANVTSPLEKKDLNVAASLISSIFTAELEQATQKIRAVIVE
ncbi:MAG: ABC-type transport auxiliary lipoprotein family protein [Bacteroidota bacterium]